MLIFLKKKIPNMIFLYKWLRTTYENVKWPFSLRIWLIWEVKLFSKRKKKLEKVMKHEDFSGGHLS